VSADPQVWIGADYYVLFRYLGWPDAIESEQGRVGLCYTAIRDVDASPPGFDLVPIKFWVVGRKVVEISGDQATALVLWAHSDRRLQVVVDWAAWDRRLGLDPKSSGE
jgi:hypothetical protein